MELSLNQVYFLIDKLKEEKGLEEFNFKDREKCFNIFSEITIGQKKLIHYLMIKGKTEQLIDVMDQLGVERINKI